MLPFAILRSELFEHLGDISFFYALRTPSEALILRRAFRNDDLTRIAPMRLDALIAIRGAPPEGCLIIRLARRRNIPQDASFHVHSLRTTGRPR